MPSNSIKIVPDTVTTLKGVTRTRWFLSLGGMPIGRRSGYASLRAAESARISINLTGRA